jgi:hypothetical protein
VGSGSPENSQLPGGNPKHGSSHEVDDLALQEEIYLNFWMLMAARHQARALKIAREANVLWTPKVSHKTENTGCIGALSRRIPHLIG